MAMKSGECPPIKEILVVLDRDCAVSRNRYDRIESGSLQVSDDPTADASTIDRLKLDNTIEFANHSFNLFVRWVCKGKAFDETELRNAALREFNRNNRLASKLKVLDENGATT